MAACVKVVRHLTRNSLESPLRRTIQRCVSCYSMRKCSDVEESSRSRVSRRRRMATLAVPEPDESEKMYPEHIKSIVEDISKLTILEVSELNQLLKTTLNIEDVPMMGMGAMAMAPAAKDESDEPEKEAEPTEFTVKLTAFTDTAKVKLIKQIKALIPGMNLVQAKKFVESVPQTVREKTNKEEAETVKKALEEAGGVVEVET